MAFRSPDDGRMAAILDTGWEAADGESGGTGRLDEAIDRRFAAPVEGDSKSQADELAMMGAGVCLPIERQPSVGYLVACSSDEAGLRGASDSLYLKRSSTLMEGGAFCGFRIFRAWGSSPQPAAS